MQLRNHTFLGMTQSLCPECLALVPAKIITKGSRVYFRKRCPTHGIREDFVCSDVVMINTNGIRLAHDAALLDGIGRLKHRVEVYFQFDGFGDHTSEILRGEPLVETKLKAVEALGRRGIKTSLVCTLQPGVNDQEIGAIVKFGVDRPWVTGISFQPATYSGRHVLPDELERRINFPDVIRSIAEPTGGM